MPFSLLSYTTATLGMMIIRAGIRGLSVVERIITPKSPIALHRGHATLTSITWCDPNSNLQRQVGQGFHMHFRGEETETQQGGHFFRLPF